MTYITTFNSIFFALVILSVLTMIAHAVIYKTGGYTFAKLEKTIYTTNLIAVAWVVITIVTCFVDLRTTCTFMLWSTIASAPISIAFYYAAKKQIKKIMADAAEINSQYPQAYADDEVDADFVAAK